MSSWLRHFIGWGPWEGPLCHASLTWPTYFLTLLVAVLVGLQVLGAVATWEPFLAWELGWCLGIRGQDFLVGEEARDEAGASGAVSFPCVGMAEGLLSPAMGTPGGSGGRLVRVGFVSIFRRWSASASCCLCSRSLLSSCSSSLRKPGRSQGAARGPGLRRKSPLAEPPLPLIPSLEEPEAGGVEVGEQLLTPGPGADLSWIHFPR